MTPSLEDRPRYATLRDYLLVIRMRWYVIVAVTVLFTAAALAIGLRQTTTYQASASVEFTDPTQGEAELLGVPSSNPQLPAQLTTNAQATLTQPPMLAQVRHGLGLRRSSPLPGSATSYVAPTTGYLVIQGGASSATAAAALANAFAHAEVTLNARATRSQFLVLANVALRELHSLGVNDQVTREVYQDRYVRLSYLAQTASPATLLTPASMPTSPSSPHRVTDAVLGLVVGLTLGLIGAFLVDALDRRLRRSGEITEELGWPILGHVREQALGRLPFADSRKKARSGLDREAFHILRRNVQLMGNNGGPRSIAVTSALPEEGKSTVAVSLAFASALAGKRTLLVECDFRRPSLAARLGLKESPGLGDYLRGTAAPAQIVQAIALPAPSNGNGGATTNGDSSHTAAGESDRPQTLFAYIAAGRTAGHPAELLASERLRAFLREVTDTYDMVVLDTTPLLPVADTLELLPDVDAAVVCLRATRTTRDQAQALKQAMARLRNDQVGLVITGVPHGAEREFGYAYAYGYQ